MRLINVGAFGRCTIFALLPEILKIIIWVLTLNKLLFFAISDNFVLKNLFTYSLNNRFPLHQNIAIMVIKF